VNDLTETIAVTAMIYLGVVALLWTIKIIRNKDHW
jgi:hypothetical protein